MKAILVNYCYRPEWLLDSGLDYLIADRSDDGHDYLKGFPPERIVRTKNMGNVDYDKLSYLVEFYDQLPEVFLWGKTNLFKYTTKEELADGLKNRVFKPLLRQDHSTYADGAGAICYYENGMYYERNNSWYLNQFPSKYQSFDQWALDFGLPIGLRYLPFPPGGNFILTKAKVHIYSQDFYARMRDTLPNAMLPGEAQLAERSYYLLWG